MNEELRERLDKLFYSEIQGGTSDDMYNIIDRAIEDGTISDDEWQNNEMGICMFFDNSWFTCEGCGWTMPISEMSEYGDWQCSSCGGDNE